MEWWARPLLGAAALDYGGAMSADRPDWNDDEVRNAWGLIGLYKLKPGDEHPTRKGWFLTDQLGPRQEPLWYKPPSKLGVIIRRAAMALYVLMIGGAVLATVLFGDG